MLERVRQARQQGYAFAQNIPIVGGATIAMRLPSNVHGRGVVIGIGGPIDRMLPQKERLLTLMRDEIAHLKFD
jgi:DNA-binding IclR family transcriptional regulator